MGVDNFLRFQVAGKRGARRSRVLLSAGLITPSGPVEARLRDISRLGALIECAKIPAVGTPVTFARGEIAVPARIAWSHCGRAGLEFDSPIDERTVLVKLRRGTKQDSNRFEPADLPRAMSRHQRKLAEAWGVTVGLTVPED